MTAIGLSLIYGTTRFTNFAHGEMVTFGALIAWFLNQTVGLPAGGRCRIAMLVSAESRARASRRACGNRCVAARSTAVRPDDRELRPVDRSPSTVFLYVFGSRTRPYSDYAVQRNGVRRSGPPSCRPRCSPSSSSRWWCWAAWACSSAGPASARRCEPWPTTVRSRRPRASTPTGWCCGCGSAGRRSPGWVGSSTR